MRYLKELISSRELLANLTLREIRGKYKRTVFGQLWSLVNPIATMLIYTFVFFFIFRVQPDAGDPSGLDIFPLWLLCGLLPWTFLANVVNQGLLSLVNNQNLIQKVYFMRIALPLSIVGAVGFNWLFEMAVLVIALSIFGAFVLPWLPFLILVMVLLAIFATGLALLLSIANVHFRDTQYMVTILLQIWMYLTPIIYPISLVETQSEAVGGILGTPVTLLGIYQLNPMFHFVELFRQLIYDNRWPDPLNVVAAIAWTVVVSLAGLAIFRRNERNLAEAL